MEKYAEIIDKGECYSTLNISINGVVANREEWSKYNFYPQNGMVGEVIDVSDKVFVTGEGVNVLKINDCIYVPMSSLGIRFIEEKEFLEKRDKVIFSGMDSRQKKINQQYDHFQNYCHKGEYSEAAVYCFSSKQALQTRQENYKQALQILSRGWKLDMWIAALSPWEFVQLIVYSVKLTLIKEKWSLTDANGIAWFVANFTEAALSTNHFLNFGYDNLFIAIFNYYQDNIGNDFSEIPVNIKHRGKNIYDWINYYYEYLK